MAGAIFTREVLSTVSWPLWDFCSSPLPTNFYMLKKSQGHANAKQGCSDWIVGSTPFIKGLKETK